MTSHTFTVSRTICGTASGCHGSPTIAIERDGKVRCWVAMPLDTLADEIVPDGATVKITVEIIDHAERKVPTNGWHNQHNRDCRCSTVEAGEPVLIHGLGLKVPGWI